MTYPYDPDTLALTILPESTQLTSLGPVRQCLLALGFSSECLVKLFWHHISSINHIRMKEFCVVFQEALRNKGLPYILIGTPPGIPE